jgi:4-amino-4-deoxy-L-arabinose transferase-like glycosyltransferase
LVPPVQLSVNNKAPYTIRLDSQHAYIFGYRMRPVSIFIPALILLAISLPYITNLGFSSIWDANEAFYAETPREMMITGDHVAPHFNFQQRVQKPPLAYWIILASYKLFGVNEFAVRLPGALAAIGILLFSYGIARTLFSPNAALMAAAISATTVRIIILARRLPIDIFLMFFLLGTLFFLIRAIQNKKKSDWILTYLCISLGFMVKGPIALVIPGGACILWALWSRKLKLAKAHIPMGAAIFIVITLPWYLLVFMKHGWTYIAPFFLRDNIGRFTAETMGPSRGYFYYFSVGAVDFFPWGILFVFALGMLWFCRKTEHPLKSLSFGLPLIWCLLTFVLFSFSKNKQEYYIAPIYPVAAIILAGVFDRALLKRNSSDSSLPGKSIATSETEAESCRTSKIRLWQWVYGFLAFLLFLLSLVTPYVFHSFMPNVRLVLHYAPSLALIAGCTILVWSIISRKPGRGFIALAGALWTIYMMCALFFLPAMEEYRPVKHFCRQIEMQMGQEDDAGSFRIALPSMVFYLRRPIFEENGFEQMEQKLRSGKRVFCILSERDYNYFVEKKDFKIFVLDRRSRLSMRMSTLLNAGSFPGEELLLISNRPNAVAKSSEYRSTL